ncbi:hypothetical protein [Acinetobacter radioresistens]|uniref:hypothetical protein n=1 Tax=Acinetobacter radioresistens TaxID=40216 RepID=UPI002003E5D1|nr:hypothetical protein [Acinetobacter radioresistens]MCK4108889.1 hypothetical protein [Acinetobacter radioresistens]
MTNTKLKPGQTVYVSFKASNKTDADGTVFCGHGVLDRVEDGYCFGRLRNGLPFCCPFNDVKMSKGVNELSLEQCLTLNYIATYYGSNVSHCDPLTEACYVDYQNGDGLYLYVGQSTIVKCDHDMSRLVSILEVRAVIYKHLSKVVEDTVLKDLMKNSLYTQMSKSVIDDLIKYSLFKS